MQVKRAAQLVANERTDDRQAGAVGVLHDPASVVRDGQDYLAVAPRQLDEHRAAAVLERVLEQLAEDER